MLVLHQARDFIAPFVEVRLITLVSGRDVVRASFPNKGREPLHDLSGVILRSLNVEWLSVFAKVEPWGE